MFHCLQDGALTKVYCLLKMWHQPLDRHADAAANIPDDVEADHAFISENGCLFPCRYTLH